jgi:class 3 adenylate cyclase
MPRKSRQRPDRKTGRDRTQNEPDFDSDLWLREYEDADTADDLTSPSLIGLLPNTSPTARDLQKDIFELRRQFGTQTIELRTARASNKEQKVRVRNLTKTLTELRKKQALEFLLARVTPQAEKAIVQEGQLRDTFFSKKHQRAFVIAIDIRRSTDLMLKARRPELFAAFMTEVCSRLEATIKDQLGVFDKFTGDGVLAFFPEFFSGHDAGYHAVTAAQQAISIFTDCYDRNRSSFSTVLRDVHLAVGIDYGPVHLMPVTGGLTVVGNAVVYACRLSGGPAKTILLNQPAYERIANLYGGLFLIRETELEIKHEGGVICYELCPSNKAYVPEVPKWLSSERVSSRRD